MEMLLSTLSPNPRGGAVTPPTPPSTEASSPNWNSSRNPFPSNDMMYVTQCLSPGSQHHTRRFSFENPMWPDEDDHLLSITSQRFSWADDDNTTIVNPSTRTQSCCSQYTLCGSVSLNQENHSSPAKGDEQGLEQFHSLHHKDLPPAPPCDSFGSFPSPGFCPIPPKKSSFPRSYGSGLPAKDESFTIVKVSPNVSFSIGDDRVRSRPTFIAQRKAPSPMEEKSAWSDSGSDDEEGSDQIARFKRRISSPLRSFLCKGKEPRRKSA